MFDLDVRDRLPDRADRALDVAETVVAVVLHTAMFVIAAAMSFGVVTGKSSVADAAVLAGAICGGPAVFYVVGWVRDDTEQKVAALVTAGEFVLYMALGVGVATAPSPGDAVFFYGGVVLAVLSYLKYDWLTARLGFEGTGEEVAA
ncbi:hypothetical protein [Halorussus aquaticus]|uniref:Uncharacterized protein n=1 Tax=Halorussus aquaticus TaxID=2953748 RepID=A0ABD5PY99_9EURY|nr:hypothetical protein [Halorussus aquaticus]